MGLTLCFNIVVFGGGSGVFFLAIEVCKIQMEKQK